MSRPAKPGKISNLGTKKKERKEADREIVLPQPVLAVEPITEPIPQPAPKQTHLLAVYGTLGSENQSEFIKEIMEPCKLIGRGHLPFYHKVSAYLYPDIIISDTSMTPVELYEVPEEAFAKLDEYEGHYKRIKTLVLTSTVEHGMIIVPAYAYSFLSIVPMPTEKV